MAQDTQKVKIFRLTQVWTTAGIDTNHDAVNSGKKKKQRKGTQDRVKYDD
jgi:hypothetical protein